MADVICTKCGDNTDPAYCEKCYEENYQNGYEKGKDDAEADAAEVEQ